MTASSPRGARSQEAAEGWLTMFEGLVARGSRSPSTLDQYRDHVTRVIAPGVGLAGLGEVTTPRLDRFVQAVLAERGYATAKQTRSALSGICGWLVRQGALSVNPVRDLTPLEQDRDRMARALSVEEMRRGWLCWMRASSRSGTISRSWRDSCWRRGCAWGRRWG